MSTARPLLRRDERRAQLLRSAAVAFAHQGYAATSVDDVAKAAGITKLIVYRHFESKDHLYRCVLEQVSSRLGEVWAEERAREDRYEAPTRTLLRVGREHPDAFRLLFVHAARETDFASFAEDLRSLQIALADELIGPMIVDGELRRWATATAIDHLVTAVLRWLEIGELANDEQWIPVATAGLIAAISAWADPASVLDALPSEDASTDVASIDDASV